MSTSPYLLAAAAAMREKPRQTGGETPELSLTAVWTGRSMILWGGAILNQQYKVFTEGASFTPTVR